MASMNLTKMVEVTRLGNTKLAEYGLLQKGWTFKLSNQKNILGMCHFDRREIEFSKYYLHIEWEEIEDTILHEIAHALVGSGHGHDYVWKQKAIEIGANPAHDAEAHIQSSAKPNYVMICPSCNRRWYRYRMKRRNFGGKCPDCRVEVKIYRYQRR